MALLYGRAGRLTAQKRRFPAWAVEEYEFASAQWVGFVKATCEGAVSDPSVNHLFVVSSGAPQAGGVKGVLDSLGHLLTSYIRL